MAFLGMIMMIVGGFIIYWFDFKKASFSTLKQDVTQSVDNYSPTVPASHPSSSGETNIVSQTKGMLGAGSVRRIL